MGMSDFRKKVKTFYRVRGRDLPWRRMRDPYRILVSEIMLQQTQVERVKTFYENFVKRFPGFAALAKAKKSDVLRVWQGLGYNRRALALKKIAEIVMQKYDGTLPHERAALEALPGVGPYTAGAIRAFAFNEPDVFIETNIRRVFIHFFFPKRKKVRDAEIMPLIAHACPPKSRLRAGRRREWYFALMDYGAMLGISAKTNPNRRSAHYAKQSKFLGSDREIRGNILRFILAHKRISIKKLTNIIPQPEERILKVIGALSREGFLKKTGGTVSL